MNQTDAERIKEAVEMIEQIDTDACSEWEQSFLLAIEDQVHASRRPLSDAQFEKLTQIYETRT